jgi:hypothetical protein
MAAGIKNLVPVSWDQFFHVFDERGLEFLYQEHTHDGHISRFNKFVYAGTDTEQDRGLRNQPGGRRFPGASLSRCRTLELGLPDRPQTGPNPLCSLSYICPERNPGSGVMHWG